jgi:ribose 5-phosphate isomerase A
VTHHAGVAGGLNDPGVQAVVTKALALIADGARVGLGSGRAASLFITNLGLRLQDGLRIIGVPTSHASAYTARKAGIPLIELGEDIQLDSWPLPPGSW